MSPDENQQSLVQRLAKRRRDAITIALEDHPGKYWRQEAVSRGWKLLNLRFCGWEIPDWINCQWVVVSSLPDSDLVTGLQAKGYKVVRKGVLPHSMDDQVPAVLPDDEAYGARAADHFFERGFKAVGYMAWKPWGEKKVLYDGLRKRAEDLGIECQLLQLKIQESWSRSKRYIYQQRKLAEWLKIIPLPIGLLGHTDYTAARLCFMAAQAGFEVPTDVAVVGPGNSPGACETGIPPISCFADYEESCIHAACELMEHWLEGEEPPREAVLVPPGNIIERQSTHVLAVPHPVVARAVQFIWDHFKEPLSVADVAEAVGVSRSKLYRLFNAHFPRTIKAELNRKRLESCQQLLQTTDLTMVRIAAATGFQSPEYMWEAFNKAFGLSPRDYRARERV